ncbi:MAG: hypothetical protein IT423_18015 [Pirellulaceae bacterium]|nr:hypothetical protein [Pirellulaceae bacterium]
MKLTLKTNVLGTPEEVWKRFDQDLFKQLAPRLPKVKLVRFDGCRTGDMVELELNFVLFRQNWISEITSDTKSEDEISFVDEGRRLPFFLKRWRHHHRLVRIEGGTQIIDAIEYHSPLRILDWLLYPSMWLQFAYRRPIYRQVFGRLK